MVEFNGYCLTCRIAAKIRVINPAKDTKITQERKNEYTEIKHRQTKQKQTDRKKAI